MIIVSVCNLKKKKKDVLIYVLLKLKLLIYDAKGVSSSRGKGKAYIF
jgi:hypothetical protein